MMVDNFELIKNKIITTDDCNDKFWFIQILIRGKDGHNEPGVNGNNKNRMIKFYTIKGRNNLDKYENEIKSICNVLNARAYIHPTPRSFREVANEMFKNFTETYISQNDLGLKSCYSTAAGKSYLSSEKMYIVDLDDERAEDDYVKNVIDYINTGCEPFNIDNKIVTIIPTLHGKHLITKPFNTAKFAEAFPCVDVHKNNPTLLYFNKEK